MVGPVLGPVLGGWLTENYSWRWCFYINLPVGMVALLGMTVFLPDSERKPGEKLDWLGFGTLSIAIAALQVLLDRGEQKDWFGSGEIWIEAIVAASAFYLFLVHTFTTNAPFVRPALFRDRNFLAGTIFIAIVGLTYYASLALQPPYLQNLMDYPVVTAGIVLAPRGVGTMIAMVMVGRLTGRLDTRVLLGAGLGLTAWAFYAATGWTPDISQTEIVIVGLVQGVGLGFLFVPLTTVSLATLPPEQRTEGSGVFNLSRNIGSSVGISVVNALLTRNTQINHAEIVAARQRGQSRFRAADGRAVLESRYGRRPRRARRHGYAAGADHRLYRRLQAVDDRDAGRRSAAHHLQEDCRWRRRPRRHRSLEGERSTSTREESSNGGQGAGSRKHNL